ARGTGTRSRRPSSWMGRSPWTSSGRRARSAWRWYGREPLPRRPTPPGPWPPCAPRTRDHARCWWNGRKRTRTALAPGVSPELRGDIYKNLTPMQRVQVARHPKRPYTLDYVNTVFTDFVELHGDRLFRDDPAIVGGWARLDGMSVMVIGHQKGRDTKENLHRN